MRRIKSFRVFVVMAFALMLSFGLMSTNTYAATNAEKKKAVDTFIQQNVTITDSGKMDISNGTLKAYVKQKADSKNTQAVTLEDGTIVYYDPSNLDLLYKQYEKYENNNQVGDKLNDISDGLKIEANTGAASSMLSGFTPIIELISGLVVILISFGMLIFTSFDILYIAFPVFRNKCEDAKQNGNSMMTKKSANGDTKLRWVSDDAQYAVSQGTIDSGKSPWRLYIPKRIISYILLAIILFIFLTGNISIITSIAVNVVSGVMDVLTNLAS